MTREEYAYHKSIDPVVKCPTCGFMITPYVYESETEGGYQTVRKVCRVCRGVLYEKTEYVGRHKSRVQAAPNRYYIGKHEGGAV